MFPPVLEIPYFIPAASKSSQVCFSQVRRVVYDLKTQSASLKISSLNLATCNILVRVQNGSASWIQSHSKRLK